MKIRTLSGSIYEINLKDKTWARLSHVQLSGAIRTEEGVFKNDPIIKIGLPLILIGDPLDETKDYRQITTSDVQEIIIEE